MGVALVRALVELRRQSCPPTSLAVTPFTTIVMLAGAVLGGCIEFVYVLSSADRGG